MAKEAEKADLMKQRLKLRERLAPRKPGEELTGAELERVRYSMCRHTWDERRYRGWVQEQRSFVVRVV